MHKERHKRSRDFHDLNIRGNIPDFTEHLISNRPNLHRGPQINEAKISSITAA